jgi:hypothetical protein
VIDMPVGKQDRLGFESRLPEGFDESLGLVSRIYDGGSTLPIAFEEIAVGLKGADLK